MTEPAGDTKRPRLLVIEDHADSLRSLRRLLERWGYPVRTADSVASALAVADEHPVDVVVSTYDLPDGDGLQVMRELSRRGAKGVIMTSYAGREEQAREAGFQVCLSKPLRTEELVRAIEELAVG